MLETLKAMLVSKKFIASLTGVVVVILETYVPGLAELPVQDILVMIGLYIAGQGLADIGKEKAKLDK